jgi:hypothetical protein
MIHPVYLLGLGAFLVRAVSPEVIADTDAWSGITHWLTASVALP